MLDTMWYIMCISWMTQDYNIITCCSDFDVFVVPWIWDSSFLYVEICITNASKSISQCCFRRMSRKSCSIDLIVYIIWHYIFNIFSIDERWPISHPNFFDLFWPLNEFSDLRYECKANIYIIRHWFHHCITKSYFVNCCDIWMLLFAIIIHLSETRRETTHEIVLYDIHVYCMLGWIKSGTVETDRIPLITNSLSERFDSLLFCKTLNKLWKLLFYRLPQHWLHESDMSA